MIKYTLLLCLASLSIINNIYGQGPTGGFRYGLEWIDPVKEFSPNLEYHLYPTPSRGINTEASYLIYLPPSYKTNTSKKYPVIYWLHGGRGSQREGDWMVQKMDSLMKIYSVPDIIMVLVQGLPTVRYINTKDGTRPVEDVIIKDLIPHIDKTYRTLNDRKYRAIEGMSMGGFGTLRLGFKFPELFGVVSGLAPSITEMLEEPDEVKENFGFDKTFYDQNGPWEILKNHSSLIKDKTKIRLFVGTQDKLLPHVTRYHELLDSLKIQHEFHIIQDAPHRYDKIISLAKFDTFEFWRTAFK
jgi:enterochelin esterase-like enzyme